MNTEFQDGQVLALDPAIQARIEARVEAVLRAEAALLLARRQIAEGTEQVAVPLALQEAARACEDYLYAVRLADPLTTDLY
jgi:hypothetical protein